MFQIFGTAHLKPRDTTNNARCICPDDSYRRYPFTAGPLSGCPFHQTVTKIFPGPYGCTCIADKTVSNYCGIHGDPTNPGGDCK